MYVFGAIILWGKVVVGTDGYRAQHARMEYLVIPTPDITPSHIKQGKIWRPINIDLDKLANELHATYGVFVHQDTKMAYYWGMPQPDLTTKSTMGGRRAGVPQLDTATGMVYKSKSAVGRALADEYGMDPDDHFVWYQIIRIDPNRFRDATKADIDAHNKTHPLQWI
jgi:hypothetical protein